MRDALVAVEGTSLDQSVHQEFIGMTIDLSTNQRVAERLREAADLFEQQGANPFRVRAYRNAAATVAELQRDLRELVQNEGLKGLRELPTIGKGIAAAVYELLTMGRWNQLERLRGTLDPVHLFCSVPGISLRLAQRIQDTLNIDTLEALEAAAHQGDLERVQGIGPRRAAALRGTLANILGRVRSRRVATGHVPSVEVLLDVDEEYREKAGVGELPAIAPKRFNPLNLPLLPVLHGRRGDWHFTAMYSNSPRAHELGRTRDWVVVYCYDQDYREGQSTIVTENKGILSGRRVVRGREPECLASYLRSEAADQRSEDVSTGFLPFGP